MQKNKTIVRDFDQYLDEEYGAIGTEERTKFEEEAKAFYANLVRSSVPIAPYSSSKYLSKSLTIVLFLCIILILYS